MPSEYYVLLGIIIALGFGAIVVIMVSFSKESKSTTQASIPNIEERISPFIEVHRSLLFDQEQEQNSESQMRLKQKIEGFKNRNRFYRP